MKKTDVSSEDEPIKVKRGNVTVKIYKGVNTVAGKAYPSFTLVYYSGAERIKQKFADLEKATREAELVATKLARGENEVLKLTPTDRAIYIQAQETLRPLNIPVHLAAIDYADMAKRLPKGVSFRQVMDYYLSRNPACLTPKTVLEVANELIEAKTKAGRGDDVTSLIFDSRNRRLVNRDAFGCEPARQIILRHWRIAGQPRLADAFPDQIAVW